MKVYSVVNCEARNSQRLINKFLEKDIPLKKSNRTEIDFAFA